MRLVLTWLCFVVLLWSITQLALSLCISHTLKYVVCTLTRKLELPAGGISRRQLLAICIYVWRRLLFANDLRRWPKLVNHSQLGLGFGLRRVLSILLPNYIWRLVNISLLWFDLRGFFLFVVILQFCEIDGGRVHQLLRVLAVVYDAWFVLVHDFWLKILCLFLDWALSLQLHLLALFPFSFF